ncbi:MAG: F0F1 ATP synthase subunit B [Clostridia bacterium]|nr:F0F1 ATP synthase subunit B [Clostridia bacterium]
MPGDVQEFVSIVPWTIILQICNLLLIVLILKKFLFKPVMNMLAARQAEVDGIYADADKAKDEANKLKETYDERMAQARSEADMLVKNATATAQRRSDEIVESAKDEAAHLRKKAEDDIEQQRRKAFSEVKTQLADMAVDIAEKMVGREFSVSDQDQLVEDFLKNAGDGK